MDRREFLQSALPAVALAPHGWGSLLLGASPAGRSPAAFRAYDLIVIGGSLAGCLAARHAARRGLRVLLVERRTFLGTEITATLRPWLQRRGFETLGRELRDLLLPEAEKVEVGVPFDPDRPDAGFGAAIPLFCGSVKKQLMAALLHEGVQVLLMTGVWGVPADREQKEAGGVALANKFGLQVAYGRGIIDATGPVAAGPARARTDHSFCLEFYRVRDEVQREISVPASLGLLDDRVRLHKGKRMPGQYFLEFAFSATRQNAEPEARRRTDALCAHLIKSHPAFAKAHLVQMAWETREIPRAEDQVARQVPGNYVFLNDPHPPELTCRDIVESDRRARTLVENLPLGQGPGDRAQFIHHASGAIPLRRCEVTAIPDRRVNDAIRGLAFS